MIKVRTSLAVFAVTLMTLVATCRTTLRAEELPKSFALDFKKDKFDEKRWSIDFNKPAGVNMKIAEEALHIIIPPGPAGRGTAGPRARFKLDGDFDLKMDYRIASLPRPSDEWVNIAILVEGVDGKAAVMRSSHSKQGQGYGAWAEAPKPSSVGGLWEFKPTSDFQGTIHLSRTSGQLRFEGGSPGNPQLVVTRDFGEEPIEVIEFHIMASPETNEPIDVILDNIEIKADRVSIGRDRNTDERDRLLILVIVLILLVLIIVVLLIIIRHKRPAISDRIDDRRISAT